MEKERLHYLYQQYLSKNLSEVEEQEWLVLLTNPVADDLLQELAADEWEVSDIRHREMKADRAAQVYNFIVQHEQYRTPKVRHGIQRFKFGAWTVAATIAILLSVGFWFYNSHNIVNEHPEIAFQNDVVAGRNGATLTLGSGKKIILSGVSNGELANEAGVMISKAADGKLVYEIQTSGNQTNQTNTITTAKGETYQMRLPDGTLIWLNAASSLTYSANLINKGVRKIKLSGEAYFEVAKDKKHPFIVQTDQQQVEVLGTHFNIKAYSDEVDVRTTLLEGSVRINSKNRTKKMYPGQQAILTPMLISIKATDVEKAVAWKNGTFKFEDENIQNIMRVLARWYDIDVQFEGKPSSELFFGEISRNKNISQVLKLLGKTNTVHFKVQGKKVTVINNGTK